jgi:hypothetical protein
MRIGGLPTNDGHSETVHVLIGHYLDECHRIEGRLEALGELALAISQIIGPEVAEREPLPATVALQLAHDAVRVCEQEAIRFLRTQTRDLRGLDETFADYCAQTVEI